MSKTFWEEFFDIFSWLILSLIMIYGILKLSGFIYNFNWFVIVGSAIILGVYMQKINTISQNLKRLKNIGQIIKYNN